MFLETEPQGLHHLRYLPETLKPEGVEMNLTHMEPDIRSANKDSEVTEAITQNLKVG